MLDFETTGLPSPGNHPRITELCFVALQREELLKKSSELRVVNKLLLCFNPQKSFSQGSSMITGLYNDALEAYEPFKSKASLICSFLKSLPQPVCLIAHNGARFDFPLMVSELGSASKELPQDILCADSLEAFRELDGLPRVPYNFSPLKKNTVVKLGGGIQATDVEKVEEPLNMLESQDTPNKRLKPSHNEWRTEEKTPECKTYQEDQPPSGPDNCQIMFGDSESPYSGDNIAVDTCSGSSLQSNKPMELKTSFPSINLEAKTTNSCQSRDVSDCSQAHKRSYKSISNSSRNINYTRVNGNRNQNLSSGKINRVNEPKVSYSLPILYRRLFGQDPSTSHTAESDCLTLLDIIRLNAEKFCTWCDTNAVQLTSVEPM
ncbi:Three-prime repair exonuclease 1 [Bulinus truncatus]|nr:Three-prime repair exonuclease 1 [Bulinus truncatus]